MLYTTLKTKSKNKKTQKTTSIGLLEYFQPPFSQLLQNLVRKESVQPTTGTQNRHCRLINGGWRYKAYLSLKAKTEQTPLACPFRLSRQWNFSPTWFSILNWNAVSSLFLCSPLGFCVCLKCSKQRFSTRRPRQLGGVFVGAMFSIATII